MAHEVPLEYKFAVETAKLLQMSAPSPLLIEKIAYTSGDKFFKKNKFWRCFYDYKKTGLKPTKKVSITAVKELYYIRMRYKKYLL